MKHKTKNQQLLRCHYHNFLIKMEDQDGVELNQVENLFN